MAADIRRLIVEYLTEAKLMQIATVKGNKPWVATVWYVHDEGLNLYFISKRARRHSLEIKENPNVAGAIVKPHTIGSGEKVRGLQFEGTAEEAKGAILRNARELYIAKFPTAEKIPIEQLEDPTFKATCYVVKPRLIVLFDEINFPDNPRQELKLE